MKMLYLSGPMSGLPQLNFPAFHSAAAMLRGQGYAVISPAEITVDHEAKWEDCLRKDLAQLVTCEVIAMLPGWENSRGARLEHHVATELGCEVIILKPPSPIALCEEASAEVE